MADLPLDLAGDEVAPRYLGAGDRPWIRALLADVVAADGRPWHELRARLRLPAVPPPSPEAKALVERQVRRAVSGKLATLLRPAVVRAAVFTAAATYGRAAAMTHAALALGHDEGEVKAALLADLPEARLVVPPSPPLDVDGVIADANQALVAQLLLRATEVRVRLAGHAAAIVRAARGRGLICQVRTAAPPAAAELILSGPLALLRRTRVYGGALASLLGTLAWADHLALEATVVLGDRDLRFVLDDRRRLRPAPTEPGFDSALEARLAADLRRLAPAWHLVREPAPLVVGAGLVFPDFALVHRAAPARRWLLELAGFWTPAYLEAKLAAYVAAQRRDLILLVDETRACGGALALLPGPVVRYRRRVDAAAVVRIIERGS